MNTFADRLRQAREKRYKTATDAARAMRLAPPTYLAHENGDRDGRRSAERYAQFFRVDYRWLMTGKGTMDGHPVQNLYDDLAPDDQRQAVDYLEYLKNRQKAG